MKRSQVLFTALLIPVDFIMLVLAAIAAYRFRVESFVSEIIPVIYALEFETYLRYASLVAITWIIIFALSGLYIIKSNRRLSQELGRIFVGCSIGLLVVVFAIFLQRELFSSRFIILTAWLFSIVFVFFGRALVLYIQRQFFKRGLAAIKVIIIGNDDHTQAIIDELQRDPGHGFRIIKNFETFDESVAKEIISLNKNTFLDEIIVADVHISKDIMVKIIEFAEENHFGFRYAADLFNTMATNTKVEPIAGIPVIELKGTRLEGWGRVFKRVFDIIVALILIVLTSPVMLIAAVAVKLTSKGPVIFRNERVGQRSKPFDTLKFRSMKAEHSIGRQFESSEEALKYEQELIKKQNTRKGPLYKIEDDPRLTPIGKFLRRWSIDELPQFFNVLKGDMSLVGPRPHQPREVEKYERHHKKLLSIKPGITGMAQVSGRSDLSFEDEAKLDIYYIENWSPWLDFQIILKTPTAIVRNRKTD